MKKIFIIVFLLAAFVFLAHAWVVGGAVWGDGRFYYSYMPSLVLNRSLGPPNKFAIGPALFWLPFFTLVHLIIRGDGFGFGYQIVVGLASVFYGIGGLYFCFLVVRRYFSERIALVGTLSIWLGSNLFFYTAVDPINSHAISFFISSVVLYFWLKLDAEKKNWPVAILGMLMGVLGMVRVQDLIFALPLLIWIKKWKRKLILAGGILLGFLPQILVWQILFTRIKSPYLIAGERFNLIQPQIMSVLFSPKNGLIFYSPIIILALIGLVAWYKRNKFLAYGGLTLFLLQLLIVAFWHNWWGGQAYGGRMFISLMPFFILGMSDFINRAKNKNLVYLLNGMLAVLNFYMMATFLIKNP